MAIKIQAPTKQTPGFARRAKTALQITQRSRDNDPGAIDAMIEFLAPFVIEHDGYASAEDALWDASEDQLLSAMRAVAGGNSTTP